MVSAFKCGDPMMLVVLVKPHDAPVHCNRLARPARKCNSDARQASERAGSRLVKSMPASASWVASASSVPCAVDRDCPWNCSFSVGGVPVLRGAHANRAPVRFDTCCRGDCCTFAGRCATSRVGCGHLSARHHAAHRCGYLTGMKFALAPGWRGRSSWASLRIELASASRWVLSKALA